MTTEVVKSIEEEVETRKAMTLYGPRKAIDCKIRARMSVAVVEVEEDTNSSKLSVAASTSKTRFATRRHSAISPKISSLLPRTMVLPQSSSTRVAASSTKMALSSLSTDRKWLTTETMASLIRRKTNSPPKRPKTGSLAWTTIAITESLSQLFDANLS